MSSYIVTCNICGVINKVNNFKQKSFLLFTPTVKKNVEGTSIKPLKKSNNLRCNLCLWYFEIVNCIIKKLLQNTVCIFA